MSIRRPFHRFQRRDASEEPADSLEGFSQRDLQSVQYVKALLDQGDTLVFVRFPNNEPVYDTTGFELRTKHTVHSEKLLESGSTYFIETLQSREQQLRLQRRFGLVGRLPEGIKYLLDLTPPEVSCFPLFIAYFSCISPILPSFPIFPPYHIFAFTSSIYGLYFFPCLNRFIIISCLCA